MASTNRIRLRTNHGRHATLSYARGAVASDKVDFFISYTGDDKAWAEWIAWQIEDAGYSTVLQAWDFKSGSNFLEKMHTAMNQAERTIAVLSDSYLKSQFAKSEWQNAFRLDPTGEKGLLVPVRVNECNPDGILGLTVYIDLVGCGEK